jgi:hypothetical protein
MTARADRLTKRAKTPALASSVRSSYPASSARVFVDALERLNYSVESLLLHSSERDLLAYAAMLLGTQRGLIVGTLGAALTGVVQPPGRSSSKASDVERPDSHRSAS